MSFEMNYKGTREVNERPLTQWTYVLTMFTIFVVLL